VALPDTYQALHVAAMRAKRACVVVAPMCAYLLTGAALALRAIVETNSKGRCDAYWQWGPSRRTRLYQSLQRVLLPKRLGCASVAVFIQRLHETLKSTSVKSPRFSRMASRQSLVRLSRWLLRIYRRLLLAKLC